MKALGNNEKEVFASFLEWTRFENLEGNFSKAEKLSDSTISGLPKHLRQWKNVDRCFAKKVDIYLDKGEFITLAIEQLINASRVLDTITPKDPIKQAIVDVGIGRTEMLRNNSENN